MEQTGDVKWKMDVLDITPIRIGEDDNHQGRFYVTNRFAEVVDNYSADAYINKRKREIKISVAGLVELYNEYWKD